MCLEWGSERKADGSGYIDSYFMSVLKNALLTMEVEQFQAGKSHCQAMCCSEFVGTPSEDKPLLCSVYPWAFCALG